MTFIDILKGYKDILFLMDVPLNSLAMNYVDRIDRTGKIDKRSFMRISGEYIYKVRYVPFYL